MKYRGLIVTQPMQFLAEAIRYFKDATISFEGYGLKQFNFERFGKVQHNSPTSSLPRNIVSPPSDFLILKPGQDGKEKLAAFLEALESYPEEICHVQMSLDGTLVLQALDSFDESGVYLVEEAARELVPKLYRLKLLEETFTPM